MKNDRVMTRRRGRVVAGATAAAIAALTLVGCGAKAEGPHAMDALRQRHEQGSTLTTFRDVAELVDTTTFRTGTKAAAPVTDAVVRGTVTDVTPGRAFTVKGEDAPDGTLTSFDDGDAQWRTFHLTVNVAETLSGSTAGNPIVVGVAFGPDATLERVRSDMKALGEVVLFLNHSPVFAYDKSVYGTVGDGAFIAPVDGSGVLTLPALDAREARSLLKRGGSVAALRSAAKGPKVVVQLDPTGTQRLSP
jgi:hypothetical protein